MLTACVAIAMSWLGGGRAEARDVVNIMGAYPAGAIVVMTTQRTLFYVLGNGRALRYPVGVGRAGMAWHGQAIIDTKLIRPNWRAPADIAAREPARARLIPGGAPNNPMGEAVLGLNVGNYAIHGTYNRSSVGHFVSHGCIRMYNEDILDLYRRADYGTPVYVLP